MRRDAACLVKQIFPGSKQFENDVMHQNEKRSSELEALMPHGKEEQGIDGEHPAVVVRNEEGLLLWKKREALRFAAKIILQERSAQFHEAPNQ